MSLLQKYLAGWQFRDSTPSLTPGEEVQVFLNAYDEREGVGVANIGGSRLYIEAADPEDVGRRVSVEVTEFDDGVGRGRFQAVVGESSYTG